MLAFWGQALTALGTIVTITPPTAGPLQVDGDGRVKALNGLDGEPSIISFR
jgi:hypothetical protein